MAQILQDDSKQQEFIQAMMQAGLQNAIQIEFNKFIGALSYERTTTRTEQRNGYYERQFNTRVGTITLHVCRDRDGKFNTALFEQYQSISIDNSRYVFFRGIHTESA